MRSLGIRVEPKATTFAVLDYDDDVASVLNVELIKIPAALDFPEQLKYVRNTVLDIIREYEVSVAGIRVAEGNTKNLSIERIHIEGVIQEAFSSSAIDRYFVGRKVSISKKANFTSSQYSDYISGNQDFLVINNWEFAKTKSAKEAVLVGYGALK